VKKKGSRRNTQKNTQSTEIIPNREVIGILLFAFACIMGAGLLGFEMGSLGAFIKRILTYALGKGAFLFPLYIACLGLGYIVNHEHLHLSKRFFSLLLFVVSLLSLWHVYVVPQGSEILPEYLPLGGGLLGGSIVFVLTKMIGRLGTIIALAALTLVSMVLTNRFSLSKPLKFAGAEVKEGAATAAQKIESIHINWKKDEPKNDIYDQEEDADTKKRSRTEDKPKKSLAQKIKDTVSSNKPILHFDPEQIEGTGEESHSESVSRTDTAPHVYKPAIPPNIPDDQQKPVSVEETSPLFDAEQGAGEGSGEPQYKFPPFSLLDRPRPVNMKNSREEMQRQGHIIEQTLSDFGVNATLVNVTKGPSVTRYEVEPAPGVKVNKIQNLAEDIALKLAVTSVRIEPIPGKAAIGIEVPSNLKEPVTFRSIVDCDEVRHAKGKLCVGLGKDISGRVIVADLSKMPHLLIAGSTGSGKSVCINTIIASLLYRARPDEVKLILVDPKVVELTNYNGIPHLLTPVVTGPKQAASALHWAVVEMERRYSLFAKTGVRKVDDYNKIAGEGEKLPFIVVIIDELSDLMMVAAVDVEDAILRLAQKARAAGIHLILATQRPSVDVLTGTIKANIPSRIAFAVSSNTDSRTILDMSGAENLLGKGDMLYFPTGANKPIRVQGAFITDEEIARIVNFIKAESIPTNYTEEVTTQELSEDKKKNNGPEPEADDPLFLDALQLVLDTHQASSSMLQRKFRIGYTRAARLVDTMEEKGIVSPADGSKPRTLRMSEAAIEERFFNKNKKKEADF
jgi:S-DNA-T family DNA segregation ATPase FtsK/SpoIIIE